MKHLIPLLAFSLLIGCDGEKGNVAPSKDSIEEATSEAPSKDSPEEAATEAPSEGSLEKQQLEMKLTEIDVAEVSSYSPWNEQVIATLRLSRFKRMVRSSRSGPTLDLR